MSERGEKSTLDRIRIGLARAESKIGVGWFSFRRKRGWIGPVSIHAYREFGTHQRVHVHGRLLSWAWRRDPQPEDPWWKNFAGVASAFLSDEVPHGRVRAELAGVSVEGETDEDGFFFLDLEFDRPLPSEQAWHEVRVQTLEEFHRGQGLVETTAPVMTPPDSASFGIISDLDDTVLQSSATDLVQTLKLIMFKNALTRTPLEGVAPFYESLVKGPSGRGANPIFYVSSAAWNLYGMMQGFLDHNEIPKGPVLLRDLGLDESRFLTGGHGHKLKKIERIFSVYPNLPFILIGDSTERDPRIYAEALERHPQRIHAIYIRDMSKKNRDDVRRLAKDVQGRGGEMLLVERTVDAARHAADHGWIQPEAIGAIEREQERQRNEGAQV